jgi:hypothetical protein
MSIAEPPCVVLEEVATKVEERFTRCYDDPQKLASAKVERQMEYVLVSTGWWLVIKRLGLALWIGKDKPAIESGDTLKISISRKSIAMEADLTDDVKRERDHGHEDRLRLRRSGEGGSQDRRSRRSGAIRAGARHEPLGRHHPQSAHQYHVAAARRPAQQEFHRGVIDDTRRTRQ